MSSPLVQELKKQLQGEVFSSEEDLKKYSTDESIFEIKPTGVVAPKSEGDLKIILEIAKKHKTSITARGGGTSIAGQAIGSGIVLDFSKHFAHILDISSNRALVQPGVGLDHLNTELEKKGLRFFPDPGSRAKCTIGGMVGTNASGPHTLKYGDARANVTNLKVILADGTACQSRELHEKFYSLTQKIIPKRNKIEKLLPRTTKNSSGYFLNSILQPNPDYTGLIVGSEGTLCLTSEIEVKTVPIPENTSTIVLGFDSVEKAAEVGPHFRNHPSVVAVELMDRWILNALKVQNQNLLSRLGLEKSLACLWIRLEGGISEGMKGEGTLIEEPEEQKYLWQLRSNASKFLQNMVQDRKPIRCIEDGVVPLGSLGTYVRELSEILKKFDCEGAIFGHAGDGHLHVNPMIDLGQPKLGSYLEKLMDETYGLIIKLGGSISGEHGDGILRGEYMKNQWGELIPLFQTIRETFGSHELLNPDKKRPGSKIMRQNLLVLK